MMPKPTSTPRNRILQNIEWEPIVPRLTHITEMVLFLSKYFKET